MLSEMVHNLKDKLRRSVGRSFENVRAEGCSASAVTHLSRDSIYIYIYTVLITIMKAVCISFYKLMAFT